jgi:acetyl-CoA synthetase
MEDCKAKVLLVASGVMRGEKLISLKSIADKALDLSAAAGHTVEKVLVYENTYAAKKADTPMKEGRDVWWDEETGGLPKEAEVEWVEAEHPLFLLYTSGSTGEGGGDWGSTPVAVQMRAGGRGMPCQRVPAAVVVGRVCAAAGAM